MCIYTHVFIDTDTTSANGSNQCWYFEKYNSLVNVGGEENYWLRKFLSIINHY